MTTDQYEETQQAVLGAERAAPTQQPAPKHVRQSPRPWSFRLLALALLLVVLDGVAIEVVSQRTRGSDPPASAAVLPLPASNVDLGRQVDPTTTIADPDIVAGNGVDYMFSSEANYEPPHIPVRIFRELGHWLKTVDAMPTLPAWAGSWVWNPDVRRVGGRYVMWFTANTLSNRLTTGAYPRCLGWATARSILGPYVASPTPSVCQINLYGAIDARTLVAPDGQEWLYWKSDGNAVRTNPLPTTIWAQKLASNGTTLEGKPIALMSNTQPWQGRVVESPQMVYARGHYYLFYSGNVSGSPNNAIGVAPCKGPAGPCTNSAVGPWMSGSPTSEAVGEESLFTQFGVTWLLYSPVGLAQTLEVSRVAFGPNGPYIAQFARLPSVG